MFYIVFLALMACSGLAPLAGPPDLHGLATWYDPCAHQSQIGDYEGCRQGDHVMRNGQPFRYDGATVAVDTSHWPEWDGARAMVLTQCGRLVSVEVTDTGLLYAAGEFRLGVGPLSTLRYWPADQEIRWLDELVYRVVADFPADTFRERVSCNPSANGGAETTVVAVWILGKR